MLCMIYLGLGGRCTRPGPPFFSIKKGCGDCSYDSVNPARQLFGRLLELSCYPGCPEGLTQGFRKILENKA